MSFTECLHLIAQSARSRRLSIWTGSGISLNAPASLPLANELKFCILRKICDNSSLHELYENRLAEGKDLGEKIKDYPLEAVIELVSRHYAILEHIAQVFRGGSPNKNHILIAKLMRDGIIRQVLTTNLDLLIERALEKNLVRGVDFEVYMTEEGFRVFGSGSRPPTIIKIHGSAENVSSMRVTLGLVASRALSEARAKLLESFLDSTEGDVLVLGYGCKDHFDINPVLMRATSKKRIFYVDHCPGTKEVGALPEPFRNFAGFSIRCDTDDVIGYL